MLTLLASLILAVLVVLVLLALIYPPAAIGIGAGLGAVLLALCALLAKFL